MFLERTCVILCNEIPEKKKKKKKKKKPHTTLLKPIYIYLWFFPLPLLSVLSTHLCIFQSSSGLISLCLLTDMSLLTADLFKILPVSLF